LEASEEQYQDTILQAAGLSKFLDWMLILRYLVFYFDDRRSLVWDPTAQRRLLRLLFLPSNQTEPDADLVTRILKQDSYYRNVSATLSRQEQEFRAQERALASKPVMEQELDDLAHALSEAQSELEGLQAAFADMDNARSLARLNALRLAQAREEAAGELEHLRIRQIQQAFPTASETATYLLTQLVAEERCVICQTAVPSLSDEMRHRLDAHRCVLCDSVMDDAEPGAPTSDELDSARSQLDEVTDAYRLAVVDRDAAELEFTKTLARMTQLDQIIAETSSSIERLESALPESSRSIHARREALAELRRENAVVREQVLADKARYSNLVEQENLAISEFQEAVKRNFDEHAKEFLLESCSLVWGIASEQVGQIGQPIRFSVFHVDMTAGAFPGATRRESAAQVSESQREFIDLAFRMALITVAGAEHAGSLVIDAPESSLDAVFAPRAARVLTHFGEGAGPSRVVLTSNLVDGQLIPTIAKEAGIRNEQDPRVVNLFKIAAPTAALRELRGDYEDALKRAFTLPGERNE
jgi:tetratricopeptide (TPR) repeat protein